VGVLEVLAEAGIPIDCVAGCSAGSILGALYCAGMSMERIRSLAPNISWRRIAELVRSDQGLLTFEKLERLIVMLIGDVEFQDLALPLAVVAMNAVNGERLIIRQGRVAAAVRASCSIPGLVTPVEFDGRSLVDGGIVDNLPVDAARALDADFVIGVDVFEPHYARNRGPLGKGLTAIETLVHNTGGGVGRADFLIAPKTAGRTYIRFSGYEELVLLGQQAARERLPLLQRAITERRLITNS
jgi:NTE family protein